MFRLRRRINALQSDAHRTMHEARETMERAQDSMSLADELLLEVKDGITFSLQIPEGHNLGDFLSGKTRKLPLELRLELEEEDDKH